MTTKVVLAWSGGKDSALALWRLQQDTQLEVTGLLTTFVRRYDRVQMHGIRRVLVEAQAEALGLPLHTVWLPPQAPNAVYERALHDALSPLQAQGVSVVAFGDLYLEDIRAYREGLLAPTGLAAQFPLWGSDTGALALEALAAGIHATVVCVDPQRLPASFLGRAYDEAFLRDLPPAVDACGENGEFHTFVHGGPPFAYPLAALVGVHREWQGFLYADLLPVVPRLSLHG